MASNEKYIASPGGYKSILRVEASVSNNRISVTGTIVANAMDWDGWPQCYLSVQIDGYEVAGKNVRTLYRPNSESVSGSDTVSNGNHTVTCSWYNPYTPVYIPNSNSVSVTVNVNYNPVSYYTISFNANGGTGAPSSITKASNQSSVTIPSTKPKRDGYVFRCWNTKSDGSGTTYYPSGAYTANANATLYAIWDVETYTISLDANGGSPDSSFTINSNQSSVTIPRTNLPSMPEHEFVCWNTKYDGSGDSYYAGGSWTKKANTTLYAVYKYVGGTVKVRVNGTWKRYAPYIFKRNKGWIRYDAYVFNNDQWKKGKS